MTKHILQIGYGFVGSYIANALATSCKLTIAPHKAPIPNYYKKTLPLNLEETHTIGPLLDKKNPDIVILVAAVARPDEADENRHQSYLVNCIAPYTIAKWCAKKNIPFIFCSTNYVFSTKGPHTEDELPQPVNYYGATKALAEHLIMSTHKKSAILRFCIPFCADPKYPTFIAKVIKPLKESKKVYPFTDQFLSPTYVCNIGFAVKQILSNFKGGFYHIGPNERFSRLDIVEKICETFSFDKSLIVPVSRIGTKNETRFPYDVSLSSEETQKRLKILFTPLDEALDYVKKTRSN